jgi:hypothetical protein
MPINLYSLPVNTELILAAVRSLGFESLDDTRWVDESFLDVAGSEQVRERLRQYLYPCFVKTYLDKPEFSYKDYITVVKQLLRTRKRKLIAKERCHTIQRGVYRYINSYTLDYNPDAAPLVAGRVVLFNLPEVTPEITTLRF